ncbi:MAG: DNA polymerase III subunit beta [Proteobacteria bacterium]|nr:DNA polymerase III subunit beta [Pseudomonadota bacterium]
MKFSITRDVLLKNLSHTQSVVEKRSSIAILSNVRLEAKDNKLVTTATDNDIAVQGTADAFVEGAGVTTVNAHKLYEIVRKLPDGVMISAELSADGSRLSVSGGKAKFSLACLDANAFPDMTTVEDGVTFELSGDLLRRLLTKAQFAASVDDTRQYLNGVYMHVQGDKLRFVATDGHRLARAEYPLPEGAADMPSVIIPRKTVGELRKLAEEAKNVTLHVTDKKIQFETSEVVLTSKVIDGTFPDYERVIPYDNKLEMDVSRQSLLQAVDRVSILSHEKSKSVKFSIAPNHLTISANNPDQENAIEDLAISYDAQNMDVGFNAKYVSEIGQLMDGEDVKFYLKDGNSPVLLKDPNDMDTLFVLMPMRI